MTKLLRSQDEEQPKDQVEDGDAGKQPRHATHHVMEDGDEFQVFVVRILLWIGRSCFHGEEITKIPSKSLAKTHFTLTSTAKEEIEIGLGMKLRHDLEGGNGKARRGWKGLGLVGRIDVAEPGK